MAIQGDGAGINIVEPHEQLDHGGLAGTGGANDGDLLAGLHLTAEIVDDGLFGHITEPNMVKGDLTIDAGRVCSAGRVGQLILFGLVQELEHALGSGGHVQCFHIFRIDVGPVKAEGQFIFDAQGIC